MSDIILKIKDISKQYKLGQIGGTTLRDELQRWRAKRRHEEDPTRMIGSRDYEPGETFMALDGVSFEVRKGERVGIIGHNGAGKSTLLKLISRITAPTSGDIWMNGRVASMLEVGTGFHGELTGRENIYMNGAILGMKKTEIDAKIEDIIEFSECRQFIDTPVKRYSSGMYVKLAFSVIAHLDAEIMIMDEVLAVGDMAFQKKCLEKMSDVSKSEGRTILYVSHNMNTIRQLCERCIVMKHGKIIFDGDVDKAIALYIGDKKKFERVVSLREMDREQDFANHIVTMTKIECLEKDRETFPVGSKINFRLDCVASKTVKEAYLRIVIKSSDGFPITMMTTEKGEFLSGSKDTQLFFCLNLSNLVPGKYTLSPIFYEVDKYGNNVTLDVLRDIFYIEIVATPGFNNNMKWQPCFWGYFYNEPLELLRIDK